jgi:hypothetical protein
LDFQLFSNLKDLEKLWLDHNKITTLSRKNFAGNQKLRVLELDNNKIYAIERGTFRNLNELSYLDLRENQCINKHYGYAKSRIDFTELDLDLEACYRNYELLRKVKDSVRRVKTTTTLKPPIASPTCACPVCMVESKECIENDSSKNDGNLHMIILGLALFLVISLLTNIVQYLIKSKNSTIPMYAPPMNEMNEPIESHYCPMDAKNLGAKSTKGSNNHHILNCNYSYDDEAHIYHTLPIKSS